MIGSCASDDKNDRVLNGYFQSSHDMNIQFCLNLCLNKGYQYAGLEFASECHCGNEPENGFEWMWQTKCDYRCSGDTSQICGGRNAMSVWTVPSRNLNGLCVHNFPSPFEILNGETRTGQKKLTLEKCQGYCTGKKSSICKP